MVYTNLLLFSRCLVFLATKFLCSNGYIIKIDMSNILDKYKKIYLKYVFVCMCDLHPGTICMFTLINFIVLILISYYNLEKNLNMLLYIIFRNGTLQHHFLEYRVLKIKL